MEAKEWSDYRLIKNFTFSGDLFRRVIKDISKSNEKPWNDVCFVAQKRPVFSFIHNKPCNQIVIHYIATKRNLSDSFIISVPIQFNKQFNEHEMLRYLFFLNHLEEFTITNMIYHKTTFSENIICSPSFNFILEGIQHIKYNIRKEDKLILISDEKKLHKVYGMIEREKNGKITKTYFLYNLYSSYIVNDKFNCQKKTKKEDTSNKTNIFTRFTHAIKNMFYINRNSGYMQLSTSDKKNV